MYSGNRRKEDKANQQQSRFLRQEFRYGNIFFEAPCKKISRFFLRKYIFLLICNGSCFKQAALGDGNDTRERVKDFTFDFSYWSHLESDRHFAPQVKLFFISSFKIIIQYRIHVCSMNCCKH